MRKRICIISFSPIYRDGRVLRQIEYLAPHYDLTVIGYGTQPDYGVEWIPIDHQITPSDKVTTTLQLLAGRLYPPLYDRRYWNRPHYRQAREFVLSRRWDAFYANEWAAVPIAVVGAQANDAPVLYDAHEFSPLEREDQLSWRWFYSPMIRYLLKRYTPKIRAAVTVCRPIADRYEREFGFKPTLILNTPKPAEVSDHPVNFEHIQLVHHGNAQSDRRQEVMIEALALADKRFHLNFMLAEQEPGYLTKLKQLAEELAPGRITFIDAVPPMQIVPTIARFDVGLALMFPSNYNNHMALPNKFFESVNAGLAVLIGQSPAMIEVASQHGFGVVSPSFRPEDIAATLNHLTLDDILKMRAASRQAARTFNADAQMAKLIALFNGWFSLMEVK